MVHQAIYRKWRPLVFEDLTGQSHITQTLKNQITSGRIAHAYLFCGTRGTGKTSAAKIFARAVNCIDTSQASPCNECEICRGILDNSILDVLEIDAASNNGVENIRTIRDEINYPPSAAKYRVYIIDEVHMLSAGAFNALLKTLEEPPAHSLFILATTEPHKVPITILSRCQRFDFKRIPKPDILARMKQIAYNDKYDIDESAFELLAELADGSMRDGLSLMERCLSASGGSLTAEMINALLGISSKEAVLNIIDAVTEKDTKAVFELIDRIMNDGRDINVFISDVISHIRSLLICKISENSSKDSSDEYHVKLKAQAEKISFAKLSAASELLSAAQADAKWVKAPRIIYEMAFVKLCRPEFNDSPSALLDRLNDLEEKVRNGITIKAVKEAPKKEPPKKKVLPAKRVFSPISKDKLNNSHPFVGAAKKWDKVINEIFKNSPHLIAAVKDKSVTIDNDGIIIIYEEKDRFSKNIADSMITQIEAAAVKTLGTEMRVKTVFKKEIEDFIIDFWALPDGDTPADSADSNDTDEANETVQDSLDALAQKFPEIVEFTDESEFLNFKADENIEQSVIDIDK